MARNASTVYLSNMEGLLGKDLRLRRRILLAGVLLFASWVLSGLLAGWGLTRRWQAPRAEPPPAGAEALRLETEDGEQLGAWWVETGTSAPVAALLLHGNRASRTHNRDLLDVLTGAGVPVLSLTLRGHGDSTGDTNDFGLSHATDVVRAVEFLESKKARRIVVIGRSLGAAAALFAAPRLEGRVHGYVLESPFSDLPTASRNRTEIYLFEPFSTIAHHTLMLMTPLFLGCAAADVSPLEAAHHIPPGLPILVLSGSDDLRARPAEAEAIARASGGEVITFPGAQHGTLFRSDPKRYAKVLLDFVARIR